MTCTVGDRCVAMLATVAGPPPPCRTSAVRPLPTSAMVTGRSDWSARRWTVRVIALVMSVLLVWGYARWGYAVCGRSGGVTAHHLGARRGSQRLAVGDHRAQITEVLHVQIGREGVQKDGRPVARIGERVRHARRDHHERAGGSVVRCVPHGAPRRAGAPAKAPA